MRRFACLLIVALALLTVACADPATAPTEVPSRTTTVSRSAAPTSATPEPGGPSAPPGLEIATVVKVTDGDTIDVEIAGVTQRLRYIGIDTPETVDPSRPDGCYGHEASDRNKDLVLGKTVALEKDVSETDAFGRLLRYVWLDGILVNRTLVLEGYAYAKAYPPDIGRQEELTAAQDEAQAAGRGLWAACTNATPVLTVTQTPPPGSGAETCEFSGTNQPVIKGNISRDGGEKIYHTPGQSSYDETRISESTGERWFCTEADAVAAGWRKSQS